MSRQRTNTLQSMCCDYLSKLRYMGKKHGIYVNAIIHANKHKEYETTQKEINKVKTFVNTNFSLYLCTTIQ